MHKNTFILKWDEADLPQYQDRPSDVFQREELAGLLPREMCARQPHNYLGSQRVATEFIALDQRVSRMVMN